MLVTYKGRKNPLDIEVPYLSKKYRFFPGTETEVVSDDGRILIDRFPQSFKADVVADGVDIDSDVFTDSGSEGDIRQNIAEGVSNIAAETTKPTLNDVITSTSEFADEMRDSLSKTISNLKEVVDIVPVETDDDFTFEEKDGSFLCPLCPKTYKVNLGRGKFAMVAHLEKDHADEWLELQTRPDEELRG